MSPRPIIAIIGRPNVGKSTFFNRLIGERRAITSSTAGTTRDRHFGVMSWFGHAWTVVDTAGLLSEDEHTLDHKELQEAIEQQILLAVTEANVIALIADVQTGIQAGDQKIMAAIRKQNKPIIIIANKADNADLRLEAERFRSLGVDAVFPVSSIHGSGIGDFVDYLTEHFPSPLEKNGEATHPKVSFIGRPNVGKSSLINRLLGVNRVVVNELPGTTRDSIEEKVTLPSGETFILVDTAGIRRRGKIVPGIERFSVFRALRAINNSDIVVLILTIEEPPTRGDAHIAAYALEANKKVIILLNKTDLARDAIFTFTPQKQHNLGQRFLRRFSFMQQLPYLFISAKTGAGIENLVQKLSDLVMQESHSPHTFTE